MGDDELPLAILWEFVVAPGSIDAFRRAYAPDGPWVALFRRGQGHLGTELLEDPAIPGRFVTIDRWASAAHWEAFRAAFAAEYEELDRACAGWTVRERPLGRFAASPAR